MFKIGELALMLNPTHPIKVAEGTQAYIGTEVKITEILSYPPSGLPDPVKGQWYKVETFDDRSFGIVEILLQKIPPGTWENVEQITGWNPTKVKEHHSA